MLQRIWRLRVTVLVGAVVLTAGRLLDLRWHATHEEFETGTDQLQAHWLAWLGAVLLFVTSAVAVRSATYRSPGFVVVLASASLYVVVAVWHFWLHQQLRDPDLPHVLLALSQLGLYVGSLMVAAGLAVPHCREKYVHSRARPAGA
jgi:drug/metabolite transporter (DMT)-like permease